MRKTITNPLIKVVFLALLALLLFNGKTYAQLLGGRTYYINGQTDKTFLNGNGARDTFPSLMGGSIQTPSKDTSNMGIIQYLNFFGVDIGGNRAPITIILTTGYNPIEPSPITIGGTTGGYPNMSDSTKFITLKTDGQSFAITTNGTIGASASLVRFNSVRWFTIDGAGNSNNRALSFVMPATAATNTSKVIDLAPIVGTNASGIQYLTIKNCNIIGSSTATLSNTYAGIYVGGISATPSAPSRGRNSYMTFTNNNILGVQNGIYYRGFSSSNGQQDDNINISKNIIGGTSYPTLSAGTTALASLGSASVGSGTSSPSGIYASGIKNVIIDGNVIRNNFIAATNYRAIFLTNESTSFSLDSNVQITNNQIYNLFSNAASSGISGIRINMGAHTQQLRMLIANNSIAKIISYNSTNSNNLSNETVGIMLESTTSNAGLEIYYNSVNLNQDSMLVNSQSTCIGMAAGVSGGVICMNNIFSNTMGSGNNSCVQVGSTSGWPFSYINYNNYYATNIRAGIHCIGNIASSHILALSGYLKSQSLRNFRLYSPSDSFSISTPPVFSNDSICIMANGLNHLNFNRGASLIYGVASTGVSGIPITVYNTLKFRITTDIYGTSRSALGRFSSIGCHHWNGDSMNAQCALNAGALYLINNVDNPPTLQNSSNGSFRNITQAINYINSYGIGGGNGGNITFEIRKGYAGEPAYLPAMNDYLGTTFASTIVFRVANDTNITITMPNSAAAPNFSSVINFTGANYVTFDGRTNKNIRFAIPPLAVSTTYRVIGITPLDTGSSNITIKNCIISGNSSATSIFTGFGIYMGTRASSGFVSLNSNLNNYTFSDNIIQAVTNGIAIRSLGSSNGHNIIRNIIGGTIPTGTAANTTYIGGTANSAGIYLKGVQIILIDSNVIRNCIPDGTLSNGFRGIDLDESTTVSSNFVLSNIDVNRNFIYNLNTITGSGCYGIRLALLTKDDSRYITFLNNYISRIGGATTSPTAGAAVNAANPAGIFIDGNITTAGTPAIGLLHNTVVMNMPVLGTNPGGTSCVYIGANIKTGISMVNNIFGNTGNRTQLASSAANNKFSLIVVGNVNPFAAITGLATEPSNKNNYFISGTGAGTLLSFNNNTQTATNIFDLRKFNSTTAALPTLITNDISSFSYPVNFLTDTTPNVNSATAGLVYGNANTLPSVCKDIYGNPRQACPGFNISSGVTARCIGAVEFDRNFVPLFGGGTYLINGSTDNPPTVNSQLNGSFATVRSAINYLNANGVDGGFGGILPVKLLLSSGYVGETDTFTGPITVLDYPKANQFRPVILSVVPNRFDTIKVPASKIARGFVNSSLIRLSGASYFEINGDNGTGSRGLTLLMPPQMAGFSNRVVDLIGGLSPIATSDSSNSFSAIRNCNIIGVSSTVNDSTFAGIYMGGVNITGTGNNMNAKYGRNNSNTFQNNFIGGVQYGIFLRSRNIKSEADNGNVISNNIIGGDVAPSGSRNTDYWGGLTNAAGISVNGQSNLSISGNIIKNNIPSFGNNRAIEVTVWPLSGTSLANTSIGSNITIEKNEIYRITSTVASSGAMGIVLNYGGTGIVDSTNLGANISINNNRISGIRASGTTIVTATASSFTNNVFGILIDAPSVVMRNNGNTQLGVSLNYNSINLGQTNTLSGTNVLSAALGISQNIRGGVSAYNNIFQNKLGVTSGTGNDVFGVAVGGTINPFNNGNTFPPYSNIDFNDYYASNPSTGATVANFASGVQTSPTSPNLYSTWDQIQSFTLSDTSSISFVAPFTNDTNLFISNVASPLFKAGTPVANVNTDVYGTARNIFNPSIGAHEFSGIEIDSVKPRIFNYSDPTACYSQGILLTYSLIDKNLISDTLYYVLNNGTEQSVQAAFSNGTSKVYLIPNQVPGTLIRVRISGNDFAGNNGQFPRTKPYDTISTSISSFPYSNGFEGGNVPYWQVIPLSGNATWLLGQQGSSAAPNLAPYSGFKTANFNSASFAANSSARLLSPCFDFTDMQNPTLRIAVSQSDVNATKLDNLDIKVGINGYYGSVTNISRVNLDQKYAFPGYKVFEVCLSNFAGLPGIRIAFDGNAVGGGQNIIIDSIQIFDDFQNQSISPKFLNACFRDSATFTIPNTDPRFVYSSYDVAKLGNPLISYSGNSSSITYKLPPNNNADTVKVVVNALNTLSGCSNYLPDTVTLAVGRFYNGPFVAPRITEFTGAFNDGTSFFPDGARVGDTLTYEIKAPSFLTNSDYGTLWTISNYTLQTSTGTNALDFTLLPGNATTKPAVRFIAQPSELNSTFNLNLTMRLLTTGCDSSYTRVLSVTSTPVPQLISSVDTVCALTGMTFTGNSLSNPSDGPYNFIWSFGDNTGAGLQVAQKTYLTGGLYTVRLTVGNRLGITGSSTKTIFVRTSPTVNFTYDLPCSGDSTKPTTFKSNTQPNGSIYLWTFPGTTQSNANASFYFKQYDTTYTVKLKVRNTVGCEQEQIQNQIYSFARPTARFTTSNVCLGLKLPLTDSSTISSGSVGRFWDFGNGDISLGSAPSYKYSASGTYLVTLIARSNYGCADTLRRTATIFDKPVANFKYTTACASGPGTTKTQPVDFTNTSTFSGGFNNVNYTWNLGDNTTYSGVTPNKTYSSIADADNPFYVKLVATELYNGCKDSITLPVVVNYKPVAQFSASRTTVCNNSPVVFNNSSRMPDNSALVNSWTFDASPSGVSNSQSPTYVFPGVNSYNVRLIVKSVSSTCSDTAYLPINVVPAPSVKIKIDNIGFGQRKFTAIFNQADNVSPTNYTWTMGDLSGTYFNVASPSFYFDKGKQWYTITLKVDDGNSGCSIAAVDSFQNDNVGINDKLANQFSIRAYPNPFSENTNLDFTLDESRNVNVTVLDMLGRSISQHAYGKLAAGKHSFRLEENEFSSTSSTYLIKIEFDDTTIYRTVVKQK